MERVLGEHPETSPFILPSGFQVVLTEGDQRAVIVEVGAGLRDYRVGDWDVLDGYQADQMCSAARGHCLIPWPNRLRDGRYRFRDQELQLPLTEPDRHNAIHGLIRWDNWTVAEQEASCVLMDDLLHHRPGYPFSLHVGVEYALSEGDPGLTVRTTATNVGSARCPYGAGFHPYLRVGDQRLDEDVLSSPGATWLPTDGQAIPSGHEPVSGTPYDFRRPRVIGDSRLDTAFTDLERAEDGLARVVLQSPDGSRSASLWMDESYRYLMLFTGDSLPDAGRRRRSLGVEPMTCAPNAFQSGEGLRVLEPGEQFTSVWGISPSLLAAVEGDGR